MTVVSKFQRGFSLIEAVVVIVIMGIMVAAVAMFLRWPFQSYLDTARRGQMSDTVDTALRRIGRDLRTALPNSVRLGASPGFDCIEFLPTITGGRYRAAVSAAGEGNFLDFSGAGDMSFDMYGQAPAYPVPTAGNVVVVYNLGSSSPGADAYAQNNTAAIASVVNENSWPLTITSETLITLTAAKLFPLPSPNNRFQVIGPIATAAVSYECANCNNPLNAQNDGIGKLRRVAGYGYAVPPGTQVCPQPAGGTTTKTLIANNVSSYQVNYNVGSATAREGVVGTQLAITRSNESVNLYDEVHVNNSP